MREPPTKRHPTAESQPQAVTSGVPLGPLANLRRRAYLTYRYHGLGSLAFRGLTFPLRFTPLARFVKPDGGMRARQSAALAWYRRHGTPVTVVIPSFRDAPAVARLVKSIRRTTPRRRVRIIVSDDGSGPEHLEALRRIRGIEVVAAERNTGFASNVNRGLQAAGTEHDVVLLNSDMVARRGWLAALQLAASRDHRIGIVGGKLLYGDGRIQFAGTVRNLGAPEWFDHRYRFKADNWGPANVTQQMLAVTGACMYLRRELLDRLGGFDEAYPMAYEDVDYCLRAWQAGYSVIYCPEAELEHTESITRGSHVGERERESQRVFWARWGDFFDARSVRGEDGALRIIYVTQNTGVGGGHRDIFEHANRLSDRGHRVEVWSLTGPPDWFELKAPVRTFDDYRELIEALKPIDAIKIATWWETADPVWEASVLRGIPVYFVQDIETSYYPDSEAVRHRVLASYRHEFQYLTISEWNAERLREFGFAPTIVPPGIDLEQFHRLPEVRRRGDMLLALGRSNPLKNLPLTLAAWRALPTPRPELCLFGIEPGVAPDEERVRYVTAPSDDEVNQLLNEATAFVQTSSHEGFCLPALEAMATACPVVCTDAHGNRDYCEDGRNCLMPEADVHQVASALQQVLTDAALRDQFAQAGPETAAAYTWPRQIDALERFFDAISQPRPIAASTDAVPELRKQPAQ
ncbi:MAG TPA: glycosyltransferase [Solirubrobacteraceae bacterium]|nr:glycosyltransferase [Solirubrobacteraceae bacterium]